MKNILILTTILLATGLIALKATGQEQLEGTLTVDFKEETAVYTESHSFDMTATVEESDCLKCLKRYTLDECKIFTCEGVNYNKYCKPQFRQS